MKIHEYQAKDLLKQFHVPVPRGDMATTSRQARQVAEELAEGPFVVKAQIHAGGRGKGGGIKTAASFEEVEKLADQILGMTLVTPQTGPEGKVVNKVLVEQAQDIAQELYLGMVVDRTLGRPVIMMSAAGGMEIEEVAARTPELIFKEAVNPAAGCLPFQARNLAFGIGLAPTLIRPATSFIENLYRLFISLDCSLAEINPLVVTKDGAMLALDAKLNLDDNALFRHHELAAMEDPEEMDPLEHEARKHHLNYIRLTGNVGAMVNGAGLAMATMDLIKAAGAERHGGQRLPHHPGRPQRQGSAHQHFRRHPALRRPGQRRGGGGETGPGQGAHHRAPGRHQRGPGTGDPEPIRPHLHRGHRHAGRGQESGGPGRVKPWWPKLLFWFAP
jgi:succinyl-CoA synthetase beta subunit